VSAGNLITIDDTNSGWSWNGWYEYADANCLGQTAHGNAVAGDYGQYTFTGTSVQLSTWKGPNGGNVQIYLDGTSQGIFSEHNASDIYNQQLFSASNLATSSHTIKVVAQDTNWSMVDYLTYSSGGGTLNGAEASPASTGNVTLQATTLQ
jgi:hypothetical protein